MDKRGTTRVLEYSRLATGFAHVRASRYGIRYCSGGYSSTNAGAGAGAGPPIADERGVYFRSCAELFKIKEERASVMSIDFYVHLLEIYNEEI